MRTNDPISYTDEQLRQTIARLEITIPRDQSILAHARRQLRKREREGRKINRLAAAVRDEARRIMGGGNA